MLFIHTLIQMEGDLFSVGNLIPPIIVMKPVRDKVVQRDGFSQYIRPKSDFPTI